MSRQCRYRGGSEKRRRLEFNAVLRAVKRNKAGFITRLQRRLKQRGACLIYEATTSEGYPNITLRYNGTHVCMKAHRLFLILKTCAPIPIGFDAGHKVECRNRACVLHIELQHFTENARATNGGHTEALEEGIPF